jgi:hypothetical protein
MGLGNKRDAKEAFTTRFESSEIQFAERALAGEDTVSSHPGSRTIGKRFVGRTKVASLDYRSKHVCYRYAIAVCNETLFQLSLCLQDARYQIKQAMV